MKKTFKRILVIMLVVVMTIGIAPLSGFVGLELPEFGGFKKLADSVSDFFNIFGTKAEATTEYVNGDYTFTIDENGNATIIDVSTSIGNHVTIPSTLNRYPVTCIGERAFYNCSRIRSITIGSGVISIEDSAFYFCGNLTSITISRSVENIGEDAFWQCLKLTDIYYLGNIAEWCSINFGNIYSNPMCFADNFYVQGELFEGEITIPDGTSTIGDYAFYNYSKITGISIPKSIINIGFCAFRNCFDLEQISVDKDNMMYSTDEYGVLFNKGGTDLICCPIDILETNYMIPEGVINICAYSFERCSSLTNISFPNSVESIEKYAFSYCTSLINVSIPDSVYYIGECAFDMCLSLSTVEIEAKLTSINNSVFSGCTSLETVYLPKSVNTIENYAFSHCSVENIVLPESLNSIGEGAFYGCDDLTEIIIFNNVSNIGKDAFYNTKIYNDPTRWENGVLYIGNHLIKAKTTVEGDYIVKEGTKTIADYAFYDCSALTSIDGLESLTSIGNYSFYNCPDLENINVTNALISIGDYAFYNCISLLNITLHDSLLNIGEYAFYNCSSLVNLNIGKNIKTINESTFEECYSLKNIQIGSGVTKIYNDAFHGCSDLTTVTISHSVSYIGENAFYLCNNLKDIYYLGKLIDWCNIEFANCFSNPMLYADHLYVNGVLIKGDLILPTGISIIGRYVFYNCADIISVTISDGVTSIDDYAFSGCSSIKSITIPDSLTIIGNYAFNDCSNLKNITIPDGVTEIGEYVFKGCSALVTIYIPNSVTNIGGFAFNNCSSFSFAYYSGTPEQWNKISVGPYNNSLIDNIVFECDSDKPYYLPGTCGENLIWTLYSNGDLVISGEGRMMNFSYPSYAPWNKMKDKIKTVTICEGVTSVGDYAFRNCFYLEKIMFPESLTIISSESFSGCEFLEEVRVSGYQTNIEKGTFSYSPKVVLYCKSSSKAQSFAESNEVMYTIIDGETPGIIIKDKQVVGYIGVASNPKISSKIKSIGENSFKDNEIITNIELPDSIRVIYSSAFANCPSLRKIFIPYTVTTIATNAFENSNVTIICYENTFAHRFAIDTGINYELVQVTLDKTSLVLKVDENTVVTATINQEFLGAQNILWQSSDTNVANVDGDGKITAKNKGEVSIYVLSPNNEILATCLVMVVPSEYNISWIVDDKITTQTNKVGNKIKEISSPQKIGYKFVGWTPEVPEVMPDYDLTFIAVFEPVSTLSIKNNSSSNTINYGETLRLTAETTNKPIDVKIYWYVNGNKAGEGETFDVTLSKGSVEVTVKLVDANGNVLKNVNGEEISDSETVSVNSSIWQKIVSFFKNLFGFDRTVVQSIFKGIF